MSSKAHSDSFSKLIQEHQQLIHKVCCLYFDQAEDREDLFQEITIQAWQSYKSFKGLSKFSTWLYRIALHTAISFYKKSKRKASIELEDYSITYQDEYSAATYDKKYQMMYKAIQDLSKVEKAIISLYFEEYKYAEIGDILGISENYVAVKMGRIKEKIKSKVTDYAS